MHGAGECSCMLFATLIWILGFLDLAKSKEIRKEKLLYIDESRYM